MKPPLGEDIDPQTLDKITNLLQGSFSPSTEYENAQLRELAFWRWVAYEGYDGKTPQYFPEHQKNFMIACFKKTGWYLSQFSQKSVFELGSGPLGMIEFVPARYRFAFDPLNNFYSKLFKNIRSDDIHYISTQEQLAQVPQVDFGICFNVLDHTSNAKKYFNLFASKIIDSGNFLLQLNTIRKDVNRTLEHSQMHPSPVTFEEALSWVKSISDDAQYELSDQPSVENEFFFMAWGTKRYSISFL